MRIINVKYLNDYILEIEFHTKEKIKFNFKPMLKKSQNPLIKKYLDVEKFKHVILARIIHKVQIRSQLFLKILTCNNGVNFF